MGLAILTLCCGITVAGESWIHVRVDSDRHGDDSVRVSLPFALVEALLPMVQIDQLDHGRLKIDDLELDGLDLREVLTELARSGDAEFVKVRDGSATVTVSKTAGLLLVNVDDSHGDPQVRVRIPLGVVEALLGDDGNVNDLDLAAALGVLHDFEGDLVTVRDGDETVRVWIDDKNFILE
jgi:hypothetical protein